MIAPRALAPPNGIAQRRLALGVQIRIRLIQNQNERIAVERTRKCDPLALTAGQMEAIADLCIIPIR